MNLVSKKVEVYFSVIDGKIINGTMLCNSLNFTWNNAYCNKLKTIYVRSDYIGGNSTDTDTFINCPSLVGGSGTKYDPTFIDSTAARIDGGVNNPGYFTSISDKPLETQQTNEETVNEVRSVEAPVKEPDELESDSKQNESESQQWGSFFYTFSTASFNNLEIAHYEK